MGQSQIGTSGVDARCFPEIDRMIQTVVTEGKAPFCVYGIYEQGSLVHVNGFGTPETLAMHYETLRRQTALSQSAPSESALAREHLSGVKPDSAQQLDPAAHYAHMRLRIASMSKSFTAAAVLRLVWQGRIDLNAPIAALLPEMAMTNIADDAFPITIADLLSMRSGLATDDAWADRQESMSHAQFRQLLGHGLRTVFRPGEGYEYSNIGFALLGEAVHLVTGSDLPTYVRTEFLEPLGLHETSYDYRDADPRMLICGHHRAPCGAWEFEEFTAPGAFSPIGGVISTVHDIVRWNTWLSEPFWDLGNAGAALPNGGGSLSDDIVLPRRFRRLMQIGHTPVPPIARSGSNRGRLTRRETSESQSYGYGLVLEHDARYGDIAHHSGGYPGYGSDMRWHLGSGIGIVTMADGRYATPGGVAAQALATLLECSSAPARVPARNIRLWPQTTIAMNRVCAMLHALPHPSCDAKSCLAALRSLGDLFSMNIVIDMALERRADELAAILAQTGPLTGRNPAEAGADADLRAPSNTLEITAQTPAQLSWTMCCQYHPLRCSIRLSPLQPPGIESLEFAVADLPKTDDIITIEPQTHIIADAAGIGHRAEPDAQERSHA
ncbi:MAG: beta-lactamase family protein [Bifidobacterium sp.]|jgi:CubicO group peptidase (beta-lactamase class C family)|nr:beta-lactamase family protein [Bifidobacterium sp.]